MIRDDQKRAKIIIKKALREKDQWLAGCGLILSPSPLWQKLLKKLSYNSERIFNLLLITKFLQRKTALLIILKASPSMHDQNQLVLFNIYFLHATL